MMNRFTKGALIVLALAAIVPGALPAGATADKTVVMVGSQNVPQVVVLEETEKITWQNLDPLQHDVSADSTVGGVVGGVFPITSPLLGQNATWSCSPTAAAGDYKWSCQKDVGGVARTITLKAGRYAYLCRPHEIWQHGVIVVV